MFTRQMCLIQQSNIKKAHLHHAETIYLRKRCRREFCDHGVYRIEETLQSEIVNSKMTQDFSSNVRLLVFS